MIGDADGTLRIERFCLQVNVNAQPGVDPNGW
jgi:hypothetical protein